MANDVGDGSLRDAARSWCARAVASRSLLLDDDLRALRRLIVGAGARRVRGIVDWTRAMPCSSESRRSAWLAIQYAALAQGAHTRDDGPGATRDTKLRCGLALAVARAPGAVDEQHDRRDVVISEQLLDVARQELSRNCPVPLGATASCGRRRDGH